MGSLSEELLHKPSRWVVAPLGMVLCLSISGKFQSYATGFIPIAAAAIEWFQLKYF